uniref:Uncharacterized protein n=1 Tax=viral metagenome TaxID=1070528 RepID=A0A2V0RBB6_9ZZZZ
MTSIVTTTRDYAVNVAQAALNGFKVQVRGDLEAPNGDENVRMFTAKGGSAITLGSTVTSAAMVYDPEASLRKGQLDVMIYGRNASDVVVETKRVTLGRNTNEFIAAGILSSGMKIFNSSGIDVIGGTQSAAVLTSVPRDISKITTTDLANFSSNHERDLASGVVSREDSTMSLCMTEHFGRKMALCRENTVGNIVRRTWDDGLGTRRTTEGETLTFPLDRTISLSATPNSDTTILANNETQFRLIDTDRLTSANNPLTLATYSAEVEFYGHFGDPNGSGEAVIFKMKAMGLDAAGNIVATNQVVDVAKLVDNSTYDVRMRATVTSSTTPIARVILGYVSTSVNVTDAFLAADSVGKVTATEETSDIPARPIHVCVLEGLNASATINISTMAVICGVPDSSNVFISSSIESGAVFDQNAVEIFLRSLVRVMPRAFTVEGHGAVTKALTGLYGSEAVDVAFHAMSFDGVAKFVKKAANLAKVGATDAQKLLMELEPMMASMGAATSTLPGPVGAVGRAAVMGSQIAKRMH